MCELLELRCDNCMRYSAYFAGDVQPEKDENDDWICPSCKQPILSQ